MLKRPVFDPPLGHCAYPPNWTVALAADTGATDVAPMLAAVIMTAVVTAAAFFRPLLILSLIFLSSGI